jgi:hypothetical protein
MVALGTEVGAWYLAKRQGQNVADAAAVAAVQAIEDGTQFPFTEASYKSAAAAVAQQNGLTDGINGVTVQANWPPTSGTHISKFAVEVIISQAVNPVLTALFVPGPMTIQNRAVAALDRLAETSACVVSFEALTIDGASFAAGNCGIASDASISVSSSPGAPTLMSVGVCSGCTAPFHQYQTPVTNFYQSLDATPMSDFFTAASCNNVPAANGAGLIELADPAHLSNPANTNVKFAANGVVAYCDPNGLNTTNGTTLWLHAGATYVLAGMNLNFSGGTVTCVDCSIPDGVGLTIVLTGSYTAGFDPTTTGTISISNTAVNMNAPQTSPTNAVFNGVLLYRDIGGLDTGPGCTTVSISEADGSDMAGAMYFRSSCVSFSGNISLSNTCTMILAKTLVFPAEVGFLDTDCGPVGTVVPVYHIVDLLE